MIVPPPLLRILTVKVAKIEDGDPGYSTSTVVSDTLTSASVASPGPVLDMQPAKAASIVAPTSHRFLVFTRVHILLALRSIGLSIIPFPVVYKRRAQVAPALAHRAIPCVAIVTWRGFAVGRSISKVWLIQRIACNKNPKCECASVGRAARWQVNRATAISCSNSHVDSFAHAQNDSQFAIVKNMIKALSC